MKSPSQMWKELSWKSAGQRCKTAAARMGVFLLYVAGIYLVISAWLYEPWYNNAAVRFSLTLAGIAVFAGAWYLGRMLAPHAEELPSPSPSPAARRKRKKPTKTQKR